MRAIIIESPKQMRVGDWADPKPGPKDVLLAVQAAGICAGDMYFYLGKNPYAVYPQICGHEIAGVVLETGSEVRDIRVGTQVAVNPFIGCGTCYPCRIGKPNCCAHLQIVGVHKPGGYAEFLTVPASHVYQVPPGLSPVVASLAEPVAIGVHACRRGSVEAGEYVLVLGAGPIGLAILEVARSRGARVAVADVMDSRLEFARELGAETFKADANLLERVLEETGGDGAPVVMEATGSPDAMEQTASLVAPGGRIVIVGLVKPGVGVTFPGLDFTRKEMSILGSRASVNCFLEALQLLADGAIRYMNAASEFDLWTAPDVFAELAANPAKVYKGVLVLK